MRVPLHLSSWFPFLQWPRPTGKLIRLDAAAGLTMGLMLVPQAVAYAALAGMPLVTGLSAALIPALVAVLWGSSMRVSVGPTALTCLLISAALNGLATPGSPEWVSLAVWLALLSGALQIILGVIRFGWLIQLLTSPVLMGFTQAAAWLILLSQLPALLGLKGGWSVWLQQPVLMSHWDGWGMGLGVGALLSFWGIKRFWPRFPGVVPVMAIAAIVSWLIDYEGRGGSIVGTLPPALPQLFLPTALPWDILGQLVLPVLAISLVSFLETAASATADHRAAGTRWNENQDLVAQGLAKWASAFCGAFATSSSFSRSAVLLYSGARTGWSTVIACGVVLVAMLWLTPWLYHLPQSALSALVIMAITGMIRPKALVQWWRISRAETLIGLATFVLTLLTAPRLYWGVLVGAVLNLSLFLYQRLHPRIIEVGLHPDGSLRDRHLWHLPPLASALLALRMDAALDFASASTLERRIEDTLCTHPHIRHVVLFAQSINRLDITGIESFGRLRDIARRHDCALHIVGLKLPVQTMLEQAQMLSPTSGLKLYRSESEAITLLQQIDA